PGYDRHFAILEHFGIEMINIPMTAEGPDMDLVEEYVKDPKIKGMFCVPKYSNPDGITYSEEVVERIASLKTAANDFRIIWDNAYNVHDLGDESDYLGSILKICEKYGNEDMVIEVASTSKVTFPGSGVALLAASDKNIAAIKKRMSVQTIGHDKLNQLRHAHFLQNAQGLKAHMKKHAAVLAPKFDIVLKKLDAELAGTGIAQWNKPKGGYFISLNVLDGCAKRTVELCKEAGVVLTPAGATFPYGKDPKDSNIRIAPTFPPNDELETAVDLLCLSTKIAALEKLTA
ncbi:MAG TPA: aminotransferase class I/II-fold pyridoxal phosphate-dependent enzyme, partial [Clostridiales bacterium]|nr:aminotransferase class I/II-fold pyridoxal phosphate-dependent enzyme [Clostridiales bacterium]